VGGVVIPSAWPQDDIGAAAQESLLVGLNN
jgi:hypothetical protein